MALQNKIYQPLSFFERLDQISYNRKNCKGYCDFKHITTLNTLPSFVFVREASTTDLQFFLRCPDSNVEQSITISTSDAGTFELDGECIDYYFFNKPDFPEPSECGFKVIRVFDGVNEWFSDIIYFDDFDVDNPPYYRLEWKSTCDIPFLPISAFPDFMFCFYLPIGSCEVHSDYREEFDVDVDSNSIDVTLYSKRIKRKKIQTNYVPEYVMDMLYSIQDYNTINIFHPNKPTSDREELCIEDFKIDAAEPDDSDCNYLVTLSYQSTKQLTNSGCCNTLSKSACAEDYDIAVFGSYSPLDLSNLTPSASSTYYIVPGAACGCEFDLHIGEFATYNGSSFNFNPPEDSAIYSIGTPLTSVVIYDGMTADFYPLVNFIFAQYNPISQEIDLRSVLPKCYFGELLIEEGATTTTVRYTRQELYDGISIPVNSGSSYDLTLTAKNLNCTDIVGATETITT